MDPQAWIGKDYHCFRRMCYSSAIFALFII
jgi:hypothetical protein